MTARCHPACLDPDCPACARSPDPATDPLVAAFESAAAGDAIEQECGSSDEAAARAASRLAATRARLSAVLAAAREVVDAYRAIEAFAVPYASCPGHTNEAVVRDDGRHDACEACRANDRADADLDAAERVLAGSELNLSNALAAADGAA